MGHKVLNQLQPLEQTVIHKYKHIGHVTGYLSQCRMLLSLTSASELRLFSDCCVYLNIL